MKEIIIEGNGDKNIIIESKKFRVIGKNLQEITYDLDKYNKFCFQKTKDNGIRNYFGHEYVKIQ